MGFDLQWERDEGDGGSYHFNLGRMGLTAKFCTNDGWLVTSTECRLLAAALATRGAAALGRLRMTKAGRASWTAEAEAFARYCRRAARQGGFRVW